MFLFLNCFRPSTSTRDLIVWLFVKLFKNNKPYHIKRGTSDNLTFKPYKYVTRKTDKVDCENTVIVFVCDYLNFPVVGSSWSSWVLWGTLDSPHSRSARSRHTQHQYRVVLIIPLYFFWTLLLHATYHSFIELFMRTLRLVVVAATSSSPVI